MPSLFIKIDSFRSSVNRRARSWFHWFNVPHLNKVSIYAGIVVLCILGWLAYVTLWRPTAEIIVDGKKITTHRIPATVGDLLKQQKIVLGEKDVVLPSLDSEVPRREAVVVFRVTEKTERIEEEPKFCILWNKESTSNLRPIQLQKTIMKRKVKNIKTIFYDGQEKERQILKEWETNKTIYRLITLDNEGQVDRIYDLSRCKKIKMIATAYYPGDPLAWKDGTETFLGHKMQRGIVAVDPKVIPLRTRVYVPGYGYGFAGDTGSAIKGKRIDLGVNNAKEEKSWMHKPVVVYILEKNNHW